MLMTIYVDNGLVAASDKSLIDKFFSDLNKEFKIMSSKEVKSFLGLEINRLKDGSIFIFHFSIFIIHFLIHQTVFLHLSRLIGAKIT